MKKATISIFLLALAIGAGAQSFNPPHASDTATNSGKTIHVLPVAKPGPVAVPRGGKK